VKRRFIYIYIHRALSVAALVRNKLYIYSAIVVYKYSSNALGTLVLTEEQCFQ